jgi:pyruvate-ferredoxin/flavodoxin oxidoreductase
MIAAPERIRVNCDLRHVNVVLCCDPKAFTHTNPLDGMSEGGSLVWESDEEGEAAWERLPLWARKQIIDKKIRVFTLPGFKIAREATDRGDLQLRMQGNAFLGAFFSVSPMLGEFGITPEQFRDAVHKQYVKKFGKLGDAVVSSNMEVMTKGFELVREIKVGELEAADRSSLRGKALLPVVMPETLAAVEGSCGTGCRTIPPPPEQGERTPLTRIKEFDAMFRAKLGYNQPANAYASLGVMAAGSGDTASKYVARRETPLYIPENCTQCMECIAVCPDTALPNCSQDLDTILRTAVTNYVSDAGERQNMLNLLPEISKRTREMMRAAISS